jgi:hypothetical protein
MFGRILKSKPSVVCLTDNHGVKIYFSKKHLQNFLTLKRINDRQLHESEITSIVLPSHQYYVKETPEEILSLIRTPKQNTRPSKILSNLSKKYSNVLKNPQSILGPNHLKVLDFWIYLDTLSNEEKKKMYDRFLALDFKVQEFAIIASRDAAREVVGEDFRYAAWLAAWNVTEWYIFGNATEELIGDVKNKVAYDLIMSHKNS